ncbi:hypothetical protein B0J13DRAFT_665642 [Dactylonectria estremocensis]|uniref:Enoyl reductase (ER) domain-containing protein n=1 Tax=Dactylonectria estremocensis TaxID=1079267 RepID=A0A9P9EUR4_9HYPO|nr:hypothetical protein B0J13DRAFT_665642 [Dactylonectria estremocensis]
MAAPKTYSAFRRTSGDLPRTIELTSEVLPNDIGPTAVLIRIHAVSLNFRDVAMLTGMYPVEVEEFGIPASDCAAEVIEIGSAVRGFKIGDCVTVLFDTTNFTGAEDEVPQCLGGDVPGVLREFAVYEERLLLKLPEHLTWEEGAVLSCAGLTAWTALEAPGSIGKARSVLLQGTGGVSMCALVICLAAGIQPIITSSSDKKLEFVKKMSPEIRGINYKSTPDIATEVQRITDGYGVDIVINNTGPASIPMDISMLRQKGGVVSLVGFLDGINANWEPSALMALMGKRASLKGIATGSKDDFLSMIQFLQEKKVGFSSTIDRIFPFHESKAAFDLLLSGGHLGKVVIKI